jgi:hypothetical protein
MDVNLDPVVNVIKGTAEEVIDELKFQVKDNQTVRAAMTTILGGALRPRKRMALPSPPPVSRHPHLGQRRDIHRMFKIQETTKSGEMADGVYASKRQCLRSLRIAEVQSPRHGGNLTTAPKDRMKQRKKVAGF